MLAKLGRVDEARRYLAELPAVAREQKIQVIQASAQLYRDAGNNKLASEILEKALVEYPDDPTCCTTAPWSPRSSIGSTSSRRGSCGSSS
jgi:tetratricopeptide (TPR) repeat protein